jgi:N-acetylneuraminate synthase
MKSIELNTGKVIGEGAPCYIIAEIGINHNGSIDIAKKLIDEAVNARVDAVKFKKNSRSMCATRPMGNHA